MSIPSHESGIYRIADLLCEVNKLSLDSIKGMSDRLRIVNISFVNLCQEGLLDIKWKIEQYKQ